MFLSTERLEPKEPPEREVHLVRGHEEEPEGDHRGVRGLPGLPPDH
jgi:hypothetical protein